MKKIPNHLGIILDGNRRWAKAKGLSPFEGHKKGLEAIKKTIEWCKEKGIKTLTLFVFSTENWKRPRKEVNYLMNMAQEMESHFSEAAKQNIKLKVIGQRDKLPLTVQASIKKIENLTKNNNVMTLNFALSYGGRAEIVEAVKNIMRQKVDVDKINEDLISRNLWTSDLDLVIRTGKEQRISNFLIWQAAYSELYFLKKYWPDFDKRDLNQAISEYAKRQRRYGK
jgi:undecaprenyl diphosphate synthase